MRRTSYHEIGLCTRKRTLIQQALDLGMGQGRLEVRMKAFLDEILGESGFRAVDGLYDVRHRGGIEGCSVLWTAESLTVGF